jgi:hypothetical protein
MTGKKNMFLFYFSITLAILSSALYHFSQKEIAPNANPAVSVLVTYALSFVICLGLLYFFPPENGFLPALRQLNWASYLLAFSLVGLEVGFLLGLSRRLEHWHRSRAGQCGRLAAAGAGGALRLQG